VTTPTSLADLLATASSLDDPERSIAYEGKGGNRIVGRRDSYKVTADLDENAKQYWLTEKNADAKGTGKVRKRLVAFLEEHGWSERPELIATESRFVNR
jgi:hypothetical protein